MAINLNEQKAIRPLLGLAGMKLWNQKMSAITWFILILFSRLKSDIFTIAQIYDCSAIDFAKAEEFWDPWDLTSKPCMWTKIIIIVPGMEGIARKFYCLPLLDNTALEKQAAGQISFIWCFMNTSTYLKEKEPSLSWVISGQHSVQSLSNDFVWYREHTFNIYIQDKQTKGCLADVLENISTFVLRT